MTNGLPVLGGFAQLVVLLVILIWFVSRPGEDDGDA